MFKLSTLAAALAVLSMSAAPAVAASSAPNSAARLSVAKSARVGAVTTGKSKQLAGGALIGIGLAVVAVIAIVVIAGGDDEADSN